MTWPSPWRRLRHRGPDRPLTALLDEGFVALDLETTGLDPRRDAIVAVAAVRFARGEPIGAYETLVDPGRPIPPTATGIHGITDAMVEGAPRIGEALRGIEEALSDHVVVGHGVAFDLALVDRAHRRHGLKRIANPVLCTRRLAAALHPRWRSFELETVAARLGVPVVGRHTARGDALVAGALLLALLPAVEARGLRTVAETVWLQDSVVSPV